MERKAPARYQPPVDSGSDLDAEPARHPEPYIADHVTREPSGDGPAQIAEH